MTYDSVDELQKVLARDIFHYAKDSKKAAGRALGTLVEIITFYLIRNWGHRNRIAIERRLPEYANSEITHNVEFSLHPSDEIGNLDIRQSEIPLTSRKLASHLYSSDWTPANIKNTQLLSSNEILRNACVLYEDTTKIIIAYLQEKSKASFKISIHQLKPHPFAIL